MEQHEITEGRNSYISVDTDLQDGRIDTPRHSTEIYKKLTDIDTQEINDPHYIIFNKMMDSFVINHHDDLTKDAQALIDIINATNQLIRDKNQQAIKFRQYCTEYIQVLESIRVHPPID